MNQNPFIRALTLILGAVIVGISLIFGFFVFLVIAGLAIIVIGIVAVRVWWLRRKLRGSKAHETRQSDDVIEGEYEVKERHNQSRNRD